MKISKNLLSAVCCIVCLALSAPNASAQFNLGKLKNKVKNEVKSKVENKAENKAENEKAGSDNGTGSAVDAMPIKAKVENESVSLNNNTNDDEFNPYKTFTISEEAKAADRFATDETIKPGFTKSVGQIHATYEHLSKIYNAADGVKAPYQPYYKNSFFYFTGTGLDDKINETFSKMLIKSIAGNPQNVYWVTDYIGIDENNPSLVVPKDETFLNALACQYIADPKSMFAFELYMKSDIYINCFDSERQYGMDDALNGMVDKDHMVPSKWKSWKREREMAAQSLSLQYISYDDMIKLANKYKDLFNKASDPTQKLLHFLVLSRLVDGYIPDYSEFKRSDDNYRLLVGLVRNTNTGELYNHACGANSEPVDEPKGVAVSADIKKLAESVAPAFVSSGAKIEKIIYLESQWHSFKNPQWPYDIIAYGLPCAVVTVENGKRYVQNVTLTKDAKTSKAFMQAEAGGVKLPLK